MLFKLDANRRLDFEFDITPSVQLLVQGQQKGDRKTPFDTFAGL